MLEAGIFQNVLYTRMKFVPIKVCWVWYAGEASGRGGLVWGGEREGVGEWLVRRQKNTENKIVRKHCW